VREPHWMEGFGRMALLRVHAATAAIFVIVILVQVFLAGLAIANLGGSGNFSTHIEFGYTWMGLAALALLVTAFAARRPRRDIGIVGGIIVLYVIQTLLPGFKSSSPAVAALHPVNALLLFVVALWYARRLWLVAMPDRP
jgi:uncharacterized protein DUF6220